MSLKGVVSASTGIWNLEAGSWKYNHSVSGIWLIKTKPGNGNSKTTCQKHSTRSHISANRAGEKLFLRKIDWQ